MVHIESTGVGLRVFSDDEGIRARTFLEAADNLLKILREVEGAFSKKATIRWRLKTLSYSSPAVFQVEPCLNDADEDFRQDIINSTVAGIDLLKNRITRPKQFSDKALASARALSYIHSRSRKIEVFSVKNEDPQEPITLSTKVAENVDHILRPVGNMEGSIEGRLQGMNSHRGFKIELYEPIFDNKISCSISEDVLEELKTRVIGMFEQDVVVSGILRTNKEGKIIAMIIHDIEARPKQAVFKSVHDIAGIYDITAGQDPELYVREMRDSQ